ncbi:MAG: hypothetical protein K0U38_05150 [Epsilonproteobacteria bacterium]|nr:hypothetical protein [Campylobacterota bacterium]
MSSLSFANESVENNSNASQEIGEGTPWITTRIPYAISAKELALRYYGDESEYKVIVEANKGIIGKNLMFKKNIDINIPVTEKFTDQPEILGWN